MPRPLMKREPEEGQGFQKPDITTSLYNTWAGNPSLASFAPMYEPVLPAEHYEYPGFFFAEEGNALDLDASLGTTSSMAAMPANTGYQLSSLPRLAPAQSHSPIATHDPAMLTSSFRVSSSGGPTVFNAQQPLDRAHAFNQVHQGPMSQINGSGDCSNPRPPSAQRTPVDCDCLGTAPLPDFFNDEDWDALFNYGSGPFADTELQLEGTEPSADLEGGMDYPRNDGPISPFFDCSTDKSRIHAASSMTSNENTFRNEVLSPEVGPGDFRSTCAQSASTQPLVHTALLPGKRSTFPKSQFTNDEFMAEALPLPLDSGVTRQFSHFSSSSSSTPEFLSTGQTTSTNSPATSASAPTPASATVLSASISSTPASASQTLNALSCCGKTFRRPCDLRRHAKNHIKPLKCPVCGTGFPDRKALDRHTIVKHPDVTPAQELYHCPVPTCPTQYVSARRDNCVRHIAKMHDKEGRDRQGTRLEPRTVTVG